VQVAVCRWEGCGCVKMCAQSKRAPHVNVTAVKSKRNSNVNKMGKQAVWQQAVGG